MLPVRDEGEHEAHKRYAAAQHHDEGQHTLLRHMLPRDPYGQQTPCRQVRVAVNPGCIDVLHCQVGSYFLKHKAP